MIPPRIATGIGAVAAIAALSLPSVATAAKKPTAQGKKAAPQFYVSLGDSYASGYQPPAAGAAAGNTREGFVYQVPALAARRGWKLRVVNFACGGATTTSILEQKDCPKAALGPGAAGYGGKTQIQAAEAFLKKNRAKVGLITVSIGGNDVTACATEPDPVACVAVAQPKLARNVATLTRRLRKAAGPRVRIVGTTYPDVILGSWLLGTDAGRSLANLSVFAFQSSINPVLKKTYEGVGGRFVDVTAATGAYTPLDQTTDAPGIGVVPIAVAKVCDLTWFCAARDIHARKSGYAIIADLVARTLPKGKQGK
ncbi:GDSL-type esterase/lipase family protein [Conexibacter sp. JD483]|uniref:GDSL-type esterase/lipase family protein n=1 Tax=unclassified Conexibacter TaxID=2627773 RepID=UPI00271D069C|nr:MULTISPECIES: GDSL-type esterase/lipase family protein [unclassified Conexibacter]MDO8184027.1 GDSL-type esterase/lipase family protein [Conexibacter sp. CPCC 205706]MDO8197019.1 GDSL-type esterase/lipase family protein [Conexibacter sp. CPCC 205762]MDR9367935.1 GDSL-type esterase/lipase family protein [Conexibacter sp. JD483]